MWVRRPFHNKRADGWHVVSALRFRCKGNAYATRSTVNWGLTRSVGTGEGPFRVTDAYHTECQAYCVFNHPPNGPRRINDRCRGLAYHQWTTHLDWHMWFERYPGGTPPGPAKVLGPPEDNAQWDKPWPVACG
jgi:hypothetical protein